MNDEKSLVVDSEIIPTQGGAFLRLTLKNGQTKIEFLTTEELERLYESLSEQLGKDGRA